MVGRWRIKPPPTGAKHQIMRRYLFLRPAVVLGAVATLSLSVTAPAWAQLPSTVATPATQLAPASATLAAPHSATCTVATDQVRFDFPLPRTARLPATPVPLNIVPPRPSPTYYL